jgi:hypothetical protein
MSELQAKETSVNPNSPEKLQQPEHELCHRTDDVNNIVNPQQQEG